MCFGRRIIRRYLWSAVLVLCQYSFDGCRSPRFILEKAQTKVWTPTGTRQNKVDRVLVLCQYSFDGCRSPRFILEKAQTKVWTPTGTRQNKVDRVLGYFMHVPSIICWYSLK